MASSYTGLGTELMTTGENAGTWGSTTNTNLQIIEQISGGYVEQSIAGGTQTTTLSVSDGSTGATLGHRIIKFTGTITGNQTVTIPLDVQQMYVLVNGTSGAYTVNFKYVSGSGSSVTFAATDKGTKLVYASADDSTSPNLVDSGIGSTAGHDLDGNELILDADADTSITADTDDQIDIKIAGADDFQFTANTFTAQSGSTIAAQALTATTITASGIVKTDDTTEATSTTDGSLQTDGGLSVAKDAVIGDDLKLLSDSAVLSFGADSDVSLTHVADTALLLNAAMRLQFRDSGLYIGSNADGDLDVVSDGTAVDSINLESAGGITLDAGTAGSGIIYEDDGTEMLRVHNSSSDVIVESKVSDKDIIFKVNDGGSATEVARFDGDVSAFLLASGKKLMLGAAEEYLSGDGTDISITVGSGGDINIGSDIGLTFGDDGEKIEGNGTDLTIASSNDLNLTATTDINIPANVGLTFGDDGEKIEGDGTDMTISANKLTIDAADDIVLDAGGNDIELTYGGTNIGKFSNNNSHFQITTIVSDQDLIIKGNDGGSFFTALTLDMSAAGAATFNDKVVATELDISGDVDIDGTLETDAITLGGSAFIKIEGTNFTDSLLVGHATTGTLSSAEDNTGVGIAALDAITSGDNNTAVGSDAATALTTGSHNTFIGSNAGSQATDMQGCIGIGSSALSGADPGNNNIAIGESAGLNITGVRNLCIGENAGDNITSGSGNVIIGSAVDPSSATDNRQLLISGNDGSTTTTWISGNNDGDLTFAHDVILANDSFIQFGDAGENIAGDGTFLTITSSNKVVIDAETDIHLDANGAGGSGGGDILFQDNGTTFLKTSNNTAVEILSAVSDQDLSIRGNDGGSEITALTFDMSAAGAATFNAGIQIADAGTIGSASDSDSISIASNGVVTFSQTPVNSAGTAFVTEDPTALAIALG